MRWHLLVAGLALGCGSKRQADADGGARADGPVATIPDASNIPDAGPHQITSAVPVTIGATVSATFIDPTTPDFYSFSGTAGQRLMISTQTAATGRVATTATDTVVTLYEPDKATVWATNDDAWPWATTDSRLFTELPMTGTYYIDVEDCVGYASGTMPTSGLNCNQTPTDLRYSLTVVDLASTSELLGASAAQPVSYMAVAGQPGAYQPVIVTGDLDATTTVNNFSVTVPSTLATDPLARPRIFFFIQPSGVWDGDGSALDVLATITGSSGNTVAQIDQHYFANGDDPAGNGPPTVSAPIQPGDVYTVSVAVSPEASGVSGYYFIDHRVGPFVPGEPEAEGPLGQGVNDSQPTAQALTLNGGVYAVDGDISSPADVDYYLIPHPTQTFVDLECHAAREGSGLLGFTANLVWGSISPGIGPETPNSRQDLEEDIQLGAGDIYLKVSATGQNPSVSSTAYRCTVYFN
jgi:hypothetical protein